MQRIHHVFVSSTYSDLIDERKKVSEAISKAGFVAEGMEIFPASSQRQFDFIKRIIDRCDYYILVLGGRYGSLFNEHTSYTRAEYEYARSKDIPILSLLHRNVDSLPSDKREEDEGFREKLEEFRLFVERTSLVDYWGTPDEAGMKAIAALSQEVAVNAGAGWIRGDYAATEDLLAEMNSLRKQNEELRAELSSANSAASASVVIENLADLDDDVEISVTLWHSRYSDKVLAETLSWREILKIVGPEYRTQKNVTGVSSALGRYFTKNQTDYSLKYDLPLFQRILMQFELLGILKASELRLKGGGTGLFYKLTEKGVSALLLSSAIRTEESS